MQNNNYLEDITNAYYTAVIDKEKPSKYEYQPTLIFNNYQKGMNVLSSIEKELRKCTEFYFLVAFITKDGIACLKNILKELSDNNIKGKILTTNYLTFNSPLAYEELLMYKNIEVKVFDGDFHIKGYFFKKSNSITFMSGSANLTQNALKNNKEWNIKLSSLENGKIVHDAMNEFNEMWESNNSIKLTKQWIAEYKQAYERQLILKKLEQDIIVSNTIYPNSMQISALNAIEQIRNKGQKRAMIISSTGTGKTYLSAFDVKAFKPKKFLFVVHREQILAQAEKSYKKVLGNNIKTGFLSGTKKDYDCDYLFATIQSLSKDEVLHKFSKDHFDMICCDEIHKAGSATYEKVIKYFNPKFMLGMSATPERTDGKDVYSLFDNNIAYEIRLNDALENDLLCPFHYFGITDIEIDGNYVDNTTGFNTLVHEIRVDYILDKAKYYGHSSEKVHGLVFCSRKEEAKQLAKMFCEKGYPSVALTGEDSQTYREEMIQRLQLGKDNDKALDYIFTVDIFNEGIDIPCVNQIIMIRPTESAIIFTQQLGRGLRKAPLKDYVIVLDFIGNYDNNYLIPIALMGDKSLNKDNLRRGIFNGFNIIPGCSTINFDKISRDRILASIDSENFTEMRKIMAAYNDLKMMLNRIPDFIDFYKFGSIDVLRIVENSGFASYYDFLVKKDADYSIRINNVAQNMLSFVDKKLMHGKRIHELIALKLIIEGETQIIQNLENIIKKKLSENEIYNIKQVLQNKFIVSVNTAKTFKNAIFIDDNFNPSKSFLKELEDENFKTLLINSIEEGIRRNKLEYMYTYKDTNFVLNKKYGYEDVCKLLCWDSNMPALNIGGYRYDEKTNTFPVFINYDKEEDIRESINYHDHFLSENIFVGISKSNRKIDSPEIKRLYDTSKQIKKYLFVRKNKEDASSKEFYFLGEIETIGNPVGMQLSKGIDVVEITYKLENPVREDLYDYIKGDI